ncbi:MAG: bifunctional enoyl-CoA hydratase/phosphate acetyltransferase [Gammaproteobacteria bacterium]|nr:bifunctional enoyl-CoA hydratase/phosphate acetyltransferase [Gammaproteobacteria bacterium]MCP5424383.1 bifunctional enoyl-CoA hydratase/phosphate acetyltransferase [Gammaproteobacteria bacterium]
MKTEIIENQTYDELQVGDTAQLTRTVNQGDIELFAAASGDFNPSHVDQSYADEHQMGQLVAHSMWGSSLFSSLLGNVLPGPGTVYRNQNMNFHRPVFLGDTLTAKVTVSAKRPDFRTVIFECQAFNGHDDMVITGTAEVTAPGSKIRRTRVDLPGFETGRQDRFAELIAQGAGLEAPPTAIAHPCDSSSLTAALEAAKAGFIVPILVGPEAKIRAVAEANELDLNGVTVVEAEHSHAAAEKAVELVRSGAAEVLMKGSLHTDELLGAVVRTGTGLRTERRLSHVFILDVPTYSKLLMVTDAAINIFPNLDDKRDICQNAINLAHALGISQPKVALLSAVEDVRTKIPSTLEAAALCKMADRGQITGALLDGPLAMDNAISKKAAITKGIRSEVAGDADILLAPDLEAGNILVKQLTFLGNADAAGLALGARATIILTSRADSLRVKLASCAMAKLDAHHRRKLREIPL